MRLVAFALASLVAFATAQNASNSTFNHRDYPLGGNCTSALRIHMNNATCDPQLFSYRIFHDVWNGTTTNEIDLESGYVITGEFAHDIHLCQEGNYSVLISNHGANASCTPVWSLTNEQNVTFFASNASYHQGSQAYFSLDKHSCYKLYDYVLDFVNHTNATEQNNTCYGMCFTGVMIHATEPSCEGDKFNITLSDEDNATVLYNGPLVNYTEKTLTLCSGNYSLKLTNDAFNQTCSPNWSITDVNGVEFFSTSKQFNESSEAYFQIVDEQCVNLTKYGADKQLENATADNSTCAATVTPTDAPTVPPTEHVDPTHPTSQTDSSANHFWLHTFWGIFLIVLFCILALLLIGYIVYTCVKSNKAAHGSEAEKQPILRNEA